MENGIRDTNVLDVDSFRIDVARNRRVETNACLHRQEDHGTHAGVDVDEVALRAYHTLLCDDRIADGNRTETLKPASRKWEGYDDTGPTYDDPSLSPTERTEMEQTEPHIQAVPLSP